MMSSGSVRYSHSSPDFFSFFFFQAEDGIRDLTVTGVQTCALPISSPTLIIWTTIGGKTPVLPSGSDSVFPSPTLVRASRIAFSTILFPEIRATISSPSMIRSEEHTSELQSQSNLVCRLLLEKKKNKCNK